MEQAFIVSGARSPIARSHKGSLAKVRMDDLGAKVVKEVLRRVPGLDLGEIEDVIVGCAMPEGEQGLNIARSIALLAGIPVSVPAFTVNRFCASSMEAIHIAAKGIMCGLGDIYVVAGVETMTNIPMGGFNPSMNPKFKQKGFPDVYIPMGLTAENLAKAYSISREEQDIFAFESHRKAVKAQNEGRFKEEIIPIEVREKDKVRIFDRDECPRPDTSLEKLALLEPAFLKGGTVTPGNSSPLSDGASALVLMSEKKIKELKIAPLVGIRAMAVSGLEPEMMGLGPVRAVKKALKRAGLRLDEIDLIELNEAFSAQVLAVIKELELEAKKINPYGGAVALGHPLGATGARIVITLISGLLAQGKRLGLATMCVGGGQGSALIVEKV